MQNPIQKCRQSSIVFEKPGVLSENLKTLTSSNYPTVQYILLKLCTRFLLTNVLKSVCGIFLFCLDHESLAKKKNDLVSTHSFFTVISITQNLSKIKKLPHTLLQTSQSRKHVQNISKKIKLYGSCSSFSIFQTKNLVSQK